MRRLADAAAMLMAGAAPLAAQTVATTTDLIRVVVTEANFDLACWSMQVFDAGAWVKLDRFLNSKSTSNRSGSPCRTRGRGRTGSGSSVTRIARSW